MRLPPVAATYLRTGATPLAHGPAKRYPFLRPRRAAAAGGQATTMRPGAMAAGRSKYKPSGMLSVRLSFTTRASCVLPTYTTAQAANVATSVAARPAFDGFSAPTPTALPRRA